MPRIRRRVLGQSASEEPQQVPVEVPAEDLDVVSVSEGLLGAEETEEPEIDSESGSTEPQVVVIPLERRPYYRRAWVGASKDELRAELCGWALAAQLPKDSEFEKTDLILYLLALNEAAANCVPPREWPHWNTIIQPSEVS